MTNRKQLIFHCPAGLHRQVQVEAVREGITMREWLVRAVTNALRRPIRERKPAEGR